ncbi:DeoR/GlpR family transcriptional regulator of sugar metabolism [Arthrobacter sp. GAS37]|uniref:DeoR/GlpR family DNA-binding transcription regulator n=1 Tax=Arthrobacter sp. GAS37 TaxID=3156261 RepID=UPI0038348574
MATNSHMRRDEIVKRATTVGLTGVEELAARFNVTASTIRRDLARLTAEGLLARTYGGAIAPAAHPESALRQRAGEAYDAKLAIARTAAQLIQPGESVLLDAGSTIALLAHELKATSRLHVATTSLSVIAELNDSKGIDLECLGGRLRALSQAFVGPLTEAALERMTFDRAFLGADGVSATDGVCEAELTQTRLKELMARRAERVYVLAHGAKIGHRPFHFWTRLGKPWTLVTDESADPDELRAFEAEGIDVLVAKNPAAAHSDPPGEVKPQNALLQ